MSTVRNAVVIANDNAVININSKIFFIFSFRWLLNPFAFLSFKTVVYLCNLSSLSAIYRDSVSGLTLFERISQNFSENFRSISHILYIVSVITDFEQHIL